MKITITPSKSFIRSEHNMKYSFMNKICLLTQVFYTSQANFCIHQKLNNNYFDFFYIYSNKIRILNRSFYWRD